MQARRPAPNKRPRPKAMPKAIRARPAPEPAPKPEIARSAQEALGYAEVDLNAAAQVAWQYAQVGGWEIARDVFKGLSTIEPRSAYYALALGLAHDRLGEDDAALAAYRRSAALDPQDPRPEINRAEIHLKKDERKQAMHFLKRAQKKARAHEPLLFKKASSILSQLTN